MVVTLCEVATRVGVAAITGSRALNRCGCSSHPVQAPLFVAYFGYLSDIAAGLPTTNATPSAGSRPLSRSLKLNFTPFGRKDRRHVCSCSHVPSHATQVMLHLTPVPDCPASPLAQPPLC